jgi:hypothetical protein
MHTITSCRSQYGSGSFKGSLTPKLANKRQSGGNGNCSSVAPSPVDELQCSLPFFMSCQFCVALAISKRTRLPLLGPMADLSVCLAQRVFLWPLAELRSSNRDVRYHQMNITDGHSSDSWARPPCGPGYVPRTPSRARYKERLAGGTRRRGPCQALALDRSLSLPRRRVPLLTGLGVRGFTALRFV